MDAANLQSTFVMCIIFGLPHTEPIYDCRRFVLTNGGNFTGPPSQCPFTPKETLQATYWREPFDKDLYCMDHAGKQNLLELMTCFGDTCLGNCFI